MHGESKPKHTYKRKNSISAMMKYNPIALKTNKSQTHRWRNTKKTQNTFKTKDANTKMMKQHSITIKTIKIKNTDEEPRHKRKTNPKRTKLKWSPTFSTEFLRAPGNMIKLLKVIPWSPHLSVATNVMVFVIFVVFPWALLEANLVFLPTNFDFFSLRYDRVWHLFEARKGDLDGFIHIHLLYPAAVISPMEAVAANLVQSWESKIMNGRLNPTVRKVCSWEAEEVDECQNTTIKGVTKTPHSVYYPPDFRLMFGGESRFVIFGDSIHTMLEPLHSILWE